MARIRSIHPDALKSEKLAAVSAQAERLYWRLQTHCDDAGLSEDSPRLFRSFLFPMHDDVTAQDVEDWMDELAEAGLVLRYEHVGRAYLSVTKWGDYQHPQRPTKSKIPEPFANGHESSASPPRVLSIGEGVGEGDGGAVPAQTDSKRKKAAHPLPDGWNPSEATREWAKAEYPRQATKAVLSAFMDHAKATDRRQVDWDSAFRNWIRNEAKWHPAAESKQPTRVHL